MDSSGFRLLAKNFTNLTEEECVQLQELARQHPYSQLIHLIHSRAAQDLRHPDKAELLNQSAVYSSDRSVLKWVMTTARKERIVAPAIPNALDDRRIEVPVSVVPAVANKIKTLVIDPPVAKEKNISPGTTLAAGIIEKSKSLETVGKVTQPFITSNYEDGLTGDALREDLYRELEKLKRLKHEFAVSLEEFQKSNPPDVEANQQSKLKNSREVATEPLLEDIKTNRKKLKVDNPKQKEQNEIIDQFIKTQPIIPKAKAQPTNDLAEDSGIFSDNIVSETLVGILLKQGKKDKAIEVLKKLIWKFPQKKAYFAAQIEELKN